MSSIKEEVVNELHKPARKNFRRRHVSFKGLNDLIQADLVEMIPYAKVNKGYRYILVVINVFSKFVWVEPVKRKTAKDVTNAMAKILSQMNNMPHNCQTDLGKEFYNKEFKNLMTQFKINHYSTYSNLKASIVERVNRTLKKLMWKKFSLQGTYKWINILSEIVNRYNETRHRTLGLVPSKVNNKNATKLLQTAYSYIKTIDPKPAKFKVGDYVRISKYREAFSKSYTPNSSNEVFIIRKVNRTNPTTYLLKDQNNQEIRGAFYGEEIQKTIHHDFYLIERVLRRNKDGQLLVKWLGLDKKHNSWIEKSDIV